MKNSCIIGNKDLVQYFSGRSRNYDEYMSIIEESNHPNKQELTNFVNQASNHSLFFVFFCLFKFNFLQRKKEKNTSKNFLSSTVSDNKTEKRETCKMKNSWKKKKD